MVVPATGRGHRTFGWATHYIDGVMAALSAGIRMGHPFERYRAGQRTRNLQQTLNIDGGIMFLTIAVVLLILWALGAFIVPIGGGLIHILLVLAVISVIWHLINGRRVP